MADETGTGRNGREHKALKKLLFIPDFDEQVLKRTEHGGNLRGTSVHVQRSFAKQGQPAEIKR